MAAKTTLYYRRRKLQEAGKLVKVTKGVYAKPEDLMDLEGDFYRATLICGKSSVICLASALQYYGLSERLSGKTVVMVPYETAPSRNKRLRVVRSRNPRFRIGVVKHPRFKITNVERSIVDTFRYWRLAGINDAIYGLKIALKERQTTKSKIYDMAKKLNAGKLILPYLEAV